MTMRRFNPIELKVARIRTQRSAADVAEAIGVARQTLNKWERGQSQPSADALAALAAEYDVDIEAFYGTPAGVA